MINAHGILLFVGGKEYYLSYDRYPWFRNAKVSDVLDVTIPDEDSLRWDAIDVDLEIDSIIHPERYPITFRSEDLDTYTENKNRPASRFVGFFTTKITMTNVLYAK